MRPRFWLSVVLALLTLSICVPVTAALATETYDVPTKESTVRKICGDILQSNGGVIGCTKGCMGGNICDFSCGGPSGPGCRVVVFPGRLQTTPETKSVLGEQVLLQGLSSKELVSKVCGQIKDRNRNANGAFITGSSGGYGCFNPNIDVLVICDDSQACSADGPKHFPVVTLRAILLGLSRNPFADGSTSKGNSDGGGIIDSP